MMAALPWYSNAKGVYVPGHGLGRRVATVPYRRLGEIPSIAATPSFTVNRRLSLPYQYIPKYDQGVEGACVGFAWSWAMSILNRRLYAARKLYLEAQLIDPWADTPPQEGTSTTAGATILMNQGHWRFARGVTWPVALLEGIESFHSCESVDEIRRAIYEGVPVVLGVNWYSNFDSPQWGDYGAGGNRWWIGRGVLGQVRGGHAICCFGARDDIEAFSLVNSWGSNYPIVNIPYSVVDRLLQEQGDAIAPTDRI